MAPSIDLAMRCLSPGAALVRFACSGIGLSLDPIRGELARTRQAIRGGVGPVIHSFAVIAGHVLRRAPRAVMFALLLFGPMLDAPAAQAQVTTTGCKGGVFADGCSAGELFVNLGTITVDFSNLNPPVRVFLDDFKLDTTLRGTQPTDFDNYTSDRRRSSQSRISGD